MEGWNTVGETSPAAGGLVNERGKPLEHPVAGDGPEEDRRFGDSEKIVAEMSEHELLVGEAETVPVRDSRSAIPRRAMRRNSR